MKITQQDLDITMELYTQALHKKEFSSLIMEILKTENPELLSHLEFIRMSFDPLESQYVVAMIILNALEVDELVAIVDDKQPKRLIPLITKEGIINCAEFVGTNGVDYAMSHVKNTCLKIFFQSEDKVLQLFS